ncbi:MAG: nucleotide pyrophosphohydrolase [Nanoarchaeota archaeon]|nr:nucleotide pyrophosphohydrolase [Nanoarchaeota archaeon]MBU1030238.1 nucleotide pyrophosphohydrolase [Nanoarchaeota archaeon]MBU1849433.1 nucleotide pyrophosphohydrolase [Nanoarchaeota archaeon]
MSLEDIRKRIVAFREARDWGQFHNAKDLAVSLSLEASEVLELFQWKKSLEEIEQTVKDKKEQLSEEVADVLLYLINLCDVADIDLEEAALSKLDKNENKYPINKAKSNAKKYNEFKE